jgi:hypothetical protein
MLGHTEKLNKFQKTENIEHMFSHHSGIRLEANHIEITGKSPYV